jgi:hypothetical protein
LSPNLKAKGEPIDLSTIFILFVSGWKQERLLDEKVAPTEYEAIENLIG